MSKSKTPQASQISASVMKRIAKGEVTMRPRRYFMLLSALVVALSGLAGFLLAYVISMGYFWLRIMTADTMAYGARRNLSAALADFPWWLVLLAVVLSIAAVWLVRKQGRMYRHHSATVLLGFIGVSLFMSLIFTWLDIGKPYAQANSGVQSTRSERGEPGWRHEVEQP